MSMETGKITGESHYACREIVAERDALAARLAEASALISSQGIRLMQADDVAARLADMQAGADLLTRQSNALEARLARVERLAAMLRDPRQWIQNEYTTRISRELDCALRMEI